VRVVLQRVAHASATPGGAIGPGLCILLGLADGDTEADAVRLADKVAKLRIFENEEGKFDRSLLETGGAALLREACKLQAEGIVSKRASGKYASGRSGDWLKMKCLHEQEFVVGGYTLPTNKIHGVGALLLGYYLDGKLNGPEMQAMEKAALEDPFLADAIEGFEDDIPARNRIGVGIARHCCPASQFPPSSRNASTDNACKRSVVSWQGNQRRQGAEELIGIVRAYLK